MGINMASVTIWQCLCVVFLFSIDFCFADVTMITQPILTEITITATSLSLMTQSYSLSTSTISACVQNSGFGQGNCQPQVTVVSVPVTSQVTEFISTVETSTIGFTTISSDVANGAAATSATADAASATIPTTTPTAAGMTTVTVMMTPTSPAATAALPSSSTTTTSSSSSSSSTQYSAAAPSSHPKTTSTSSSTNLSAGDTSDLSTGAKAGIAIAVILAFIAISLAAFWLGRRRRLRKFQPAVRQPPVAALATGEKSRRREIMSSDDDSATQVDTNSQMGFAKSAGSMPESPVTSTAPSPPHHDMEDLESARQFFTRRTKS